MIRQSHLIAVVGALLIAVVVVGCASGPGYIDDERGSEGDAATNEETTAPKGDRPKARTAQEEPVGFEVQEISPLGQGNLPAGFGEGSLWVTGCNDVKGAGEAACGSQTAPPKTLLKRVDPRSGEVVAEIPLKPFNDVFTQVAFGAGSVWVSSGYYSMGPPEKRWPGDVVIRIDPQTNRVVDRVPVDPPSGLAFGHGSVWATSAGHGTLSRIDPKTGKVVAKTEVGRAPVDVAVDENSGAVWVASVYLPKNYGGYGIPQHSEDRNLKRVDPETNRVVAQIPIQADSPEGGADKVAVGEGAVWVSSVDKLLKVDPETNEVAGMVPVGADYSHVAVYGGGVWALGQARRGFRLVRVDPSTMDVVASEEFRPFYSIAPGGLAAGGGYVWFSSGEGLARVAP